MTRRTVASLQTDLSTGGSSDGSIETRFAKDLTDSYLDLDTYEAFQTTNTAAIAAAVVNPLNVEQVLFTLAAADMNVTTDQSFTKRGTFTSYLITEIRAYNASIDLDAADGGIYQSAAKAGDAIVDATQVYTDLDAATKGLSLTLTAFGKDVLTATPILSLTGAQGAAATCAFVIIGIPLS